MEGMEGKEKEVGRSSREVWSEVCPESALRDAAAPNASLKTKEWPECGLEDAGVAE
jgi:hypothetical protein